MAAPEPEPEFSLFSSLRYDPLLLTSPLNTAASVPTPTTTTPPCPFYLLHYHTTRILRAAEYFSWPPSSTAVLEIMNFREACERAVAGSEVPLRLRTVLSPTGNLTIETNQVPPIPLSVLLPPSLPPPSPTAHWRIHIDTSPTSPSPFTSHKTTSRSHYNTSRLRVGITSFAEEKEVVLWNERGEVMEGSMTSLYFWREIGGEWVWVTPGLESGGNGGTTRRWFLEKGMVKEGVVDAGSVKGEEVVRLSNGVRGCWEGVFVRE